MRKPTRLRNLHVWSIADIARMMAAAAIAAATLVLLIVDKK